MFDKIKYHLLASYLWGVAFTFTSGDKFLDASVSELIIQPPIFALVVVILPLIIYFLSVFITKDKEKSMYFFK